nr:MAG TPA: hypothetical protein [Caudoviricetes sp.]
MGFYEFVMELAKLAVLVLSPFVAYFLGRNSLSDANRVKASEKRLREYYWPLMNRYMLSFYWAMPYSNSGLEARSKFFDLLVANSYLAGKETQRLIPEFYEAYLDVLEYNKENPKFDSSCLTKLDTVFRQLIATTYKEYAAICKRLGYPEPLEPKSAMVYFHENGSSKETTKPS